jgi:hypothetical protein
VELTFNRSIDWARSFSSLITRKTLYWAGLRAATRIAGWPEEATGGDEGYVAARDRIEELIRACGKVRVSEYLQQFKLPDENIQPNTTPEPTPTAH